jgi:type 1 glutamine amidotransferase
MANILNYTGGPYHPFLRQADWFCNQLEPLGHQFVSSEERSLFDRLDDCDLLVISALDWSDACNQALKFWEIPTKCPKVYTPLSDKHFEAIQRYVASGRPLFCHHCAIANWGERPEFGDIFDGKWVWERSTHTPVGMQVNVVVAAPLHPVCDGLTDFSLTDETYYKLDEPKRSQVILEATHEGRNWPLAWAGETPGGGRFIYSGLGHDMLSFASPSLERFLKQSFSWLLTK